MVRVAKKCGLIRVNIEKLKALPDLFNTVRGCLNEDAVQRYMELYQSGREKAIKVQAGTNIVIDGFHRLEACNVRTYKTYTWLLTRYGLIIPTRRERGKSPRFLRQYTTHTTRRYSMIPDGRTHTQNTNHGGKKGKGERIPALMFVCMYVCMFVCLNVRHTNINSSRGGRGDQKIFCLFFIFS